MSKNILITLVILIALVLASAGIYLIFSSQNKQVAPNDVPSNNISPTATPTQEQYQTIKLDLRKAANGNFDVIVLNDEDFIGVDLYFETEGQFSSFVKDADFDVELANEFNPDGTIFISIGKLNNLETPLTNKTTDGGYIIGQLVPVANAQTGQIKLDTEQSLGAEVDDAFKFEPFEQQLP